MKWLDEKNTDWVQVFKIFVVVWSAVLLAGGIVFGLIDWIDWWWIGGFAGFLVWFLCGIVGAALSLIFGMIVTNFFYNVSSIRKILEQK